MCLFGGFVVTTVHLGGQITKIPQTPKLLGRENRGWSKHARNKSKMADRIGEKLKMMTKGLYKLHYGQHIGVRDMAHCCCN